MRTGIAILLAAVVMVPVAWATAGIPIQGTDVGLEGEPGGIAVATGRTDAKGQYVRVWQLMQGQNGVSAFIADRAKLKVTAVIRIEAGRQVLVSTPILPGKGRGYATDRAGKRLLLKFTDRPRTRVQVKITVTEGPSVAEATREANTAMLDVSTTR